MWERQFTRWGRNRRRWSPATCDLYRYWTRRAHDWLRHHHSISLIHADVDRLHLWLDQLDTTAKTVNSARGALIAFYDYTVDQGLRNSNPARDIPPLPEPRRIPDALERDDARLVAKAAVEDGPRTAALVGLMLRAGLRATEARTFEWPRWEGRWLRVDGKGSKTRMVPVNERLDAALTVWRSGCPDRRWMFPSPVGGPLSYTWTYNTVRGLTPTVGFYVHPHLLRHSFATRLRELGVPLEEIADLLGHSTVVQTQVYAHVRPTHLLGAVDRLDL